MNRHLPSTDASVGINRRAVLAGSAAMISAGVSGFARPAIAQQSGSSAIVKRILFVTSNPAISPSNGMPIGYWLPEIAHPYWAFQQQGYEMTVASPQGGVTMHDAISDPDGGRFANPRDVISLGFKTARPIVEMMHETRPLTSVAVADYDAIFVIGGLAPNVTFYDLTPLHRLFAGFFEAGKVAAAICHGTCILLKTRLSDGRLIADGRRWTGYTNLEEDVVDRALSGGKPFQPFRIEDEARKMSGTQFVQGEPYKPFAVADGRLITGQQGSSGHATAALVIKELQSAKL